MSPPKQETEKDVTPSKIEHGPTQPTPKIDPEMEKRVRRKLDMNLIPLVSALYLRTCPSILPTTHPLTHVVAFLDRSNIGNARIAGMETDLHFKEGDYDWLLTIFYISYICFGFLAIMWKVVPPHYWAAFCVFTWGLVSTVQAAANSWGAMMALRFIMGASEVAYGPGVPFLLSFFYLRDELGLRSGLFLSAAPLANTFAGALAYAITSGSPALAKWRVLFLVEGLPTVAMAGVAFFFLPDSPEKARFLNEEEREVARARGVRQAGAATRVGGINVREFFTGLADPKGWILGLMYFSCNVAFSSLPVFLPTSKYRDCIQSAFGANYCYSLERDGLQQRQRPGSDCTAVLPLLPDGHLDMLHCRPHTAAWTHGCIAHRDRWHRICHPSCIALRRCKILRRLPGCSRRLPSHWQHPTMADQQSRLRHSKGSWHRNLEPDRAVRSSPWYANVSHR